MAKEAKNKNDVIKEIAECERKATIYNRLYEVLTCADFDAVDFSKEDRKQLDKELEKGEIKSLCDLGNRFDELADFEYRKANRLLKTDYKKAI